MSRQNSGRSTSFPPWLYESQFEGEGRPALYPYAQLRNILAPEDVRAAVSDECGPIEAEFGIHAVELFHRLLWLLNTTPAFFTTHVNVAPRDLKPPFDWARTQVAGQIIMLSRKPVAHDHRASAEALAGGLAKLLCAAPQVADSKGWMISVGPTPMTLIRLRTPDAPYPYRDEDLVESPGYGIVMRIRGCANSRAQAAQRWSSAVSTVFRVIEQEQNLGNIGTASPHQHVHDTE